MITADEVRKFQKETLEKMYNRDDVLINIESHIREVINQSADTRFIWYSGEFQRFCSMTELPQNLADVLNDLKDNGFDVSVSFGNGDYSTSVRIGW